jgi:molecular chaperone GrpE (heat shock protein)
MKKFELEEQLNLLKEISKQQSDTITRLWESIDNQRQRLFLGINEIETLKQDIQSLKDDGENLRIRLRYYRRKKLEDKKQEIYS